MTASAFSSMSAPAMLAGTPRFIVVVYLRSGRRPRASSSLGRFFPRATPDPDILPSAAAVAAVGVGGPRPALAGAV